MDKIDKNISDLLNDKLNQHESTFSDSLWGNIASQLPAASAPAAGVPFLKTLLGKAIIGGTAAAVISAGVFFATSDEKTVVVENAPKTEQIQTKEKTTEQTQESALSESSSIQASEPVESNVITAAQTKEQGRNETESTPNTSETEAAIERNIIPSQKPSNNQAPYQVPTPNSNPYPVNDGITEEVIDAKFQIKTVDQNALRYFFFASTDKAKSFEWSINGEVKSTDNNFSHQFLEEGEYEIQLAVTSRDNQNVTSKNILKAFKPVKFEIPNAFSPGNDGKNDFIDFADKTKNESQIISLTIVDSNGNRIFESKEQFTWYGETMQGDKAAPGAYQYILSVQDHFDQIQSKSGIIQLFAE